MIEALGQDFVRTARSKGISERRVVYRHGLRSALTPVTTIFGIDLAFQLTGAIFTERMFNLPGLGVLSLTAFSQFDLPVLMGTVLLGSVLLVTMNLVVGHRLHLPRPAGQALMAEKTTPTTRSVKTRRTEAAAAMSEQMTGTPEMAVRRTARPREANEAAYLQVENLQVQFPTADGMVKAVQGLSYSLPLQRTLAIVGESGSGKSVSSMAVMGLHDARTARISGSIKVGGTQIVGMSAKDMQQYRGKDAAMIFQDPQSSLHPYFTIGDQIMEMYRAHNNVSKKAAKAPGGRHARPGRHPEPDPPGRQLPARVLRRYAPARDDRDVAGSTTPKLLIADEPTTALDVTVQAHDPGPDRGPAARLRLGRRLHHPRPRRGRRDRRRRAGHVRRQRGRARPGREGARLAAAPVHVGGCWRASRRCPVSPQPLHPIKGSPPSLLAVPSGCAFHPRCEFRDRVPEDRCRTVKPELVARTPDPGRASRCHLNAPDVIFTTDVLPRLP